MILIAAFAVAGASAAPLSSAPAALAAPPQPCVARQLALSVDGRDGEFVGMQKSGTELSIRNLGGDCTLPTLPRIEFLDARGHVLPATRGGPAGMHPGPVMIPVRLAGGHRAAADLTWIAGPVYASNRPLRVAWVRVAIGGSTLRAKLIDVVDAQPGRAATFFQPPLRAMEGMAAD